MCRNGWVIMRCTISEHVVLNGGLDALFETLADALRFVAIWVLGTMLGTP